jgi:hypothetical protein
MLNLTRPYAPYPHARQLTEQQQQMLLTQLPIQFTKCALYKVSNIKILHVFHLSHTEPKYPAYHNLISPPTNRQDICLSSAANTYTSSLEQTVFDSRSG